MERKGSEMIGRQDGTIRKNIRPPKQITALEFFRQWNGTLEGAASGFGVTPVTGESN
jgi:hypothetical protein